MATRVTGLNLATHVISKCAEIFAKRLPQSLGARMENKSVILSFIVDQAPPADKTGYGKKNIDKYAIAAYREIFSGEDEIDLLLMDVRLVFSVLFWDGREISEVEYIYFMKDLLFLAQSKP